MADHHHHHQRPNRLSLPPRATVSTTAGTPRITTSRPPYPHYPYPPSTPTPTPSKHRLALSSGGGATTSRGGATTSSSLSFLLLLLFSLRSLYSLLPFLRSSPPSFSLFPFSFLVSLLSFLLSLSFSLFTSLFLSSIKKDPFRQKARKPIFSLTSISQSQHKLILAKSLVLSIVFLLRFQALRFCGTAAMILAELSGNVAARFLFEGKDRTFLNQSHIRSSKLAGFVALFSGLLLLSISWDRVECFPFSYINISTLGFSWFPSGKCLRVWTMLLPFLSGFLGCYERVSMNWGTIREMGQKRVRLITLFYTSVVLFVPAFISMLVFKAEGDTISISSLGWPLANTVIFGVLLSENYASEKLSNSSDLQREYLVTFVCVLILELFYFPELSLWGFLICGFLLWIAVRKLNPIYSELGMESSESISAALMKPLLHILTERKSRKIALFLLINTAYMVVEFAAGFMSNSLGLISDACHMLFDCAALAIGLYASYISRLPANHQFNYGRGRFEVLSGYVNAVFLVLVGALIVLESCERILDPQEISTSSLLTVSIGGLVVNIIGLMFFHEEHHHAHGGAGPCLHSHHHQDHHHHHHQHDKKLGNKDEERIMVVHGDRPDHDRIEGRETGMVKHDSHDHHHHHHHGHQHHHHGHHDNRLDFDMIDGHDTSMVKHDGHDHHHHGHQHHHHEHCTRHHTDQHGNHHSHHDRIQGHETSMVKHDGHDHHHHDHDHQHQHHHHEHSIHHHTDHHDHNHHHLEHHHHHHHDHNQTEPLLYKAEKKEHQHKHMDHNMQGIFLHVLADTLGSVGVVVSTLLIKYKGWLVADPACSIFISVLIISSVIPLLRNSAEILLQRVPRAYEQDLRKAVNSVAKVKGVYGIQNLHVWSFTNTDVVGTLHLHVSKEADKGSVKKQISQILHDAEIKDLTLQVESINSN